MKALYKHEGQEEREVRFMEGGRLGNLRYMAALILLSVLTVWGQITYPVGTNDLFTFKLGTNVVRRKAWPRADLMQLTGAPTNLVILKEVNAPAPSFDPATQRLDPAIWVDNTNAQTATLTNPVVSLSQVELDAIALAQTRFTQRTNLANAITILRSWADQAQTTTVTSGNAVTTLQTVVNRLGVFFDNFADLLEVERVDR